ncbi:Vesicle-associated protein 2-2 [Spatholobus suberectus]|nr:Vesicle-associated protein 2-2 [Spatholobus suberectus]
MTTDLLHIEPAELRFVFELKKQSSCLVQLGNKTDQYIAFKVKTTSPKKYCVRPNIGIIKPNEKCDFTVTMQAQRTAPPDMQCKDKFLIQSTVVPFGTAEDDITSDMFAKDSGKYIEEKKLKVVLISPPSSPVLLPLNGDMKHDPSNEVNVQKDKVPSGVENIPPPHRVSEQVKGFEPVQDMKEDRADEDIATRQVENVGDKKPAKDDVELNLANESEELKSRLSIMDSKLREAGVTIMKLNEERRRNTQEKDLLKKELEVLKRKINTKGVQAGFPFLFVCMVALIGVAVGYYVHPQGRKLRA